jgi:hypothetical protein
MTFKWIRAKQACGFSIDAPENTLLNNGLEIEMRKIFVGAAAAAAMVASSTVAQAAPTARTAAPIGEADQLAGGSAHLMLGLLAAVLLGLVLWQINDNDDVDLPVSP